MLMWLLWKYNFQVICRKFNCALNIAWATETTDEAKDKKKAEQLANLRIFFQRH